MMSRGDLHLVFGCLIWLENVPQTNTEGKKYYDYSTKKDFLTSFVSGPCQVKGHGDLLKIEQLEYYLTFPIPNEMTWIELDKWMQKLAVDEELQNNFQQSLKNLGQPPRDFSELKLTTIATIC